ncbi:Fatty acid metabolism regulator protein [compost metagenome]
MSQQQPVEQWIQQLVSLDDTNRKMTEKQLKIIQAAVEIFAEKGFAGSSTSEIAQRAGVAEGTIFRHYKTKKDLLLSIIEPMTREFIAPFILNEFKEVLEKEYSNLEDFLYALAVNRLEFIHEHFKVIKILFQEIPFHPELKEEFKKQIGIKIYHRFSEIFEYFKNKGEVIDLPIPVLIRFLISSFIGLFATHFVFLPEQAWDKEKEIRNTIQLVLHGIALK